MRITWRRRSAPRIHQRAKGAALQMNDSVTPCCSCLAAPPTVGSPPFHAVASSSAAQAFLTSRRTGWGRDGRSGATRRCSSIRSTRCIRRARTSASAHQTITYIGADGHRRRAKAGDAKSSAHRSAAGRCPVAALRGCAGVRSPILTLELITPAQPAARLDDCARSALLPTELDRVKLSRGQIETTPDRRRIRSRTDKRQCVANRLITPSWLLLSMPLLLIA